jgi:YcaO-like protein with predicted kinase domain
VTARARIIADPAAGALDSSESVPQNVHTLKAYRTGTHRAVAPAETLARVKPFLRTMGVTRLANVTGLDCIGIPVVMCCRPNSRSLAVAQGKGLDLDSAKASALMESAEGYHAENVFLPLKLSSYRALRLRHAVVDPERLLRAPGGAFSLDRPLLWVEGEDWIQKERVWVPFQLVHTMYTPSLRFDLDSFSATSTGLASGNNVGEAVSHAVCEIIERDAAHWFSRLPEEERESTRVDLGTVDHPDCVDALSRFEGAGMAVGVWDITGRLGLPAFQCLIMNRDEDPHWPQFPSGGFGCHPVRQIALLRAMTEAAQSRLTAISGGRDDMARSEYALHRHEDNLRSMRPRARRQGTRPYSMAPSFEHETFEEDIDMELGRLQRAGFDRAVVVNLTHPELGIAVVRVIVPGAEVEPPEGFGRRASEASQ